MLAAAADNTYNFSPTDKKQVQVYIWSHSSFFLKKLVTYSSFLLPQEHNVDLTGVRRYNHDHLESLFSYPPFLKPSTAVKDDQGIVELNIGSCSCPPPIILIHIPIIFVADLILVFGADDIDIDGPVVYSPSQKNTTQKKGTTPLMSFNARCLTFWTHLKIDVPVIGFADKGTERDRLFDGGTIDSKPKLRTAEEIRAKYRKDGVILYVKENSIIFF